MASQDTENDRTWTLNSSTDSVTAVIGAVGTQDVNLVKVGGVAISEGQKTMANSIPVVIASDQSPVPISGSITATNPSVGSNGAAIPTSSTLVGASDGTNLQPLKVDGSGNLKVVDVQGTSPWVVSGTVTANAGTGNFTVVQSSGANLHVNVDNFPASVPVTGTVTVNQGTSPWVDNVSQFGGSNVVTGTGASGAGIPRVTVSNDSNILSTQSGTWNINNISGTISLPTGASTSANQTSELTKLDSIITDLGIINANLTNGNTQVFITGRGVLTTFTQDYSSVNLTTGAFIQILASTASTINEIDIFDVSGLDYYLAYAATFGALSTGTNAIIVSPGGGIKDFQIPSGNVVGFKAKTSNLTAGTVNMTFYK